jgi:hypothetical protein
MVAKIAMSLALLIGLTYLGVFGFQRYSEQRQQKQYEEDREQQLSPEVKAAVTAIIGQNANVSDADVVAFLRAAKLASRTQRDAEIVGMVDRWTLSVKEAAKNKALAGVYRRSAASNKYYAGVSSRQAKEWQQEDSTKITGYEFYRKETARSASEDLAMAESDDRQAKAFEESGQRKEREANELIKRLLAIPELQAAK